MAAEPPRLDVYLAYHNADRQLARAVYKFLRSAGLRVWFDQTSLPGGAGRLRTMDAAVSVARHVVVLLTSSVPGSWWRAELDHALRFRALHPELDLVPLVRDGFEGEQLAAFLECFPASRLPAEKSLLNTHLRNLVSRLRASELEPQAADFPEMSGSPFPGLRCFEEADAGIFFGRDAETADALAGLGQVNDGHRRWLQVEGGLAVGKSSFVRAGLVPGIRRGGIEGAPAQWHVATVRPGRRPVGALARALADTFRDLLTAAEIQELLSADTGISDLVHEHLPADNGLLLLVDPLDEVLSTATVDDTETRWFDRLLATALDDFDQRLYLVTTARSDRIERLPAVMPALTARAPPLRFPLGRMRREARLTAIVGPSRLAGRELPAALVARILDDSDAAHGELPHLAWLLRALDDAVEGGGAPTPGYERLGGVMHGRQRAADRTLEAIPPEELPRARQLLLGLITPGRGALDAARIVTQGEALDEAGAGPRAQRLLARLSGGEEPGALRLVVTQEAIAGARDSAPVETVELVHEALVRHWPRLRGWIEEERRMLERRENAEQAARDWIAGGRRPEALPRGPALQHLEGADLGPTDTERMRALLTSQARHFVEAARADQRRRDEDEQARAAATAAAEEARNRSEKLRLSRRLSLQRVALAVLAVVAIAALGLAAYAFKQRGDLLSQLASAETIRRQAVLAQLGAEDRKLESEKKQLAAESELGRVQRALRQSNRAHAAAEATADQLLAAGEALAAEGRAQMSRVGEDLVWLRRTLELRLVERAEEAVKRAPGDPRLRLLLAAQHASNAKDQEGRKELKQALESLDAAVKIAQAVVREHPEVPAYVARLAGLYSEMGRFLAWPRVERYRDRDAALRNLSLAVAALEPVVKASPERAEHRQALAVALRWQADVMLEFERAGEVGDGARRSVELLDALLAATPADAGLQRDHALALATEGDVALATGDASAAAERYTRSLAGLAKLRAADPQNEDYDRDEKRIGRKLQRAQEVRDAPTP